MEVQFKTVVGSRLYGLATPTSDTDYKGFFMPAQENQVMTLEQQLGLAQFVPHQKQELQDLGDNDEGMLYSLQRFFELYVKGSPTMAEIPFAGPEFSVVRTELAERALKFLQDHCVTKSMFKGYKGYFYNQCDAFRTGKGKYREKRVDDRQDAIANDTYDGKSFSHAYRIGLQGIQLFSDGWVNPTLQGEEKEIAMTMKLNKHKELPREEAIKIIVEVGGRLEKAMDESSLPNTVDYDKVNKFLVSIHHDFYGL